MANIILSTGGALPSRVISNEELAKKVNTTHDWIVERTGIHQRHVCAEGETTATLAAEAARRAIAEAGLSPKDIDLTIVATSTPDYSFPGVASQVQGALGLPQGPAFDIQAACSGFIYALTTADSLLKAGQARTALVIGADTFSHLLNWEDRSTCVLFGDGAGAVVMQHSEAPEHEGQGLIGASLSGDAQHLKLLRASGGVATTGQAGTVQMEGREVFRHAVRAMSDIVPALLTKHGLQKHEVDWLVPHQANSRIIEATARLLELPMEQVVMTVDRHANTSAASIPLALNEAVRDGRIQRGQTLFLEAFGAGFTWAAALLKW